MFRGIFAGTLATLILTTHASANMSVAQLKQSLEQSKTTGKPLLAVAGAEWCGPCKTLDKMLKTDWKTVAAKFIYIHIDVDHDKEAWTAFTEKYDKPGNGIPMIFVIEPGGKMGFSQCGYSPKLLDVFKKFAGEKYDAKPAISNKEMSALRKATKEANDLLADGKFASAYEQLADYAKFFADNDDKRLSQAKKAYNDAVSAALDRIDKAVKEAEEPLGANRFDGAYHLTIISRTFNESEKVKEKVTEAIKKLSENEKTNALLKQAEIYDMARQAERDGDSAKAKELYERIIKEHKSSPGSFKAQKRLDELTSASK